ncbi:DUF445 domain-containing protein [Paraclostridium sordellii]|uniref:DUF445 domain-containing protein n=1 Tax=Paraclostridium sordellii TaxID=1505 RepID=UPI0005DC95C0|nr:DUF445 family protein [Paeniclostridium sordellii]CEO14071.1 membrane protein [[Clostridium] sordellii] [Paeniclostridium sordellii]CEP89314.1 membrane protein [[Clostridium] sordellii] [Paeniclostridium sordellii]CEP98124.1 membrane protein [[Clostridium] sordellii] [Paeniclostridium sordellii]CEQ01515.1 membrane protein [[Clostridium] sordellii] [Paeniclostridium sordellii]
MSNIYIILLMGIIGGIIGYVTNKLAIKLIFRPINPVKIPIVNIEILGLIPKRKNEIAIKIGEIIQDEFISVDDILENLVTEDDKQKAVDYIKFKVSTIIDEKASLMPGYIKSIIKGYVDEIIEKEVNESIDELGSEIIEKAHQRINIQEIVENKVNELDLIELENIILSVANNELKHIELLGLILGFLIGIVQGIITIFI